MKAPKILAILCALFEFSCIALAQDSPRYYYVEVYESSIMGMKSVNLDFGVDAPAGAVYKIYDDNDKNIEFKNVVAAVNYMSQQGWELLTVFEKNVKAGARTIYLMRFDASKHEKNNIVKDIDKYLKEVSPK